LSSWLEAQALESGLTKVIATRNQFISNDYNEPIDNQNHCDLFFIFSRMEFIARPSIYRQRSFGASNWL